MTSLIEEIDVDLVDLLVEFCLNEIALEGLQGCELTKLFDLFYVSSKKLIQFQQQDAQESSANDDFSLSGLNESNRFLKINKLFSYCIKDECEQNIENLRNFILKLLINQFEVEFYQECESSDATNSSNSSKTNKSKIKSFTKSLVTSKNFDSRLQKIINDPQLNQRGFCPNYFNRVSVSNQIRSSQYNFQKCLKDFQNTKSTLILVASQELRNKVLCPSFKYLDFESLNDLEFCVLEAIGRARFDGLYSIGDNGLTLLFDLVPKQLHYILVILESHELIKKQVQSSEKKRSIIHLTRFSFRKKTVLENMCEYLIQKHRSSSAAGLDQEHAYFDSSINLKKFLNQSNKQFKTLIQSGEKQNIIKRYFKPIEARFKKNKNSSKFYTKTRQIRMIKLTESYIKTIKQNSNSESSNLQEEDLGLEDTMLDDENSSSFPSVLTDILGTAQSNTLSLYTQIFGRIEESGKDGISLKQLGNLFAFDFYKSRRMGANLQTHPEIVTLIKETNRGKAKYQTIFLRKFLNQNNSKPSTSASQSSNTNTNKIDLSVNTNDESSCIEIDQQQAEEVTILKRGDGQTNKNIQALMSNRMQTRKKLVHDYIEKHKICTKYELTREIRNYELAQGFKGSIDSKTTKRMLNAMEAENKLKVFTVTLKNLSYMCARSLAISEQDDVYKNYCATFKRTFDSVDLVAKDDSVLSITDTTNVSLNEQSQIEAAENSEQAADQAEKEPVEKSFRLTRAFVSSIVGKLKFTTNYSKVYALVPKFQKAIILHRFLHYILFFYDGKQQSNQPDQIAEIRIDNSTQLSEVDLNVVESVKLPKLDRAYQSNTSADNQLAWNSFIPPLHRSNGSRSSNENCVFIGEIFSHMPLSVFCSIIVINHQVPGLVALLKHPQKRHILVKDLPPTLIAPLIFERRYLQRILAVLQLLACLGLVSFVESPCRTNEAINRDVQSQLVYVHRQALFYDTSTNQSKDWLDLKRSNKLNIENEKEKAKELEIVIQEEKAEEKYEKCLFEFKNQNDVVEYWRKLLHVSMNTYKFSVGKYLHESKRLRQELLNKIVCKFKLDQINELWPIDAYGDHMGPGLYDSQLFLNSFKNWMINPSNLSSNQTNDSLSRTKNKPSSQIDPAITKEADQSFAPFSELALFFPFGVFRGIASISNSRALNKKKPVKMKKKSLKSTKRKIDAIQSDDENKKESKKPEPKFKKLKKFKKLNSNTNKDLKLIKTAKHLVEKAKLSQKLLVSASASSATPLVSSANQMADKRAYWTPSEDELILLIKVTSLYFLPNEKSVPFKLIHDIMNQLMPKQSLDKKVSSFGRRIKILMKSKMNVLFVSNKLELCKQDRDLMRKYSHESCRMKRNLVDRELVDLYIKFMNDLKEKFLKKRNYDHHENCQNEIQSLQDNIVEETKIDLPDSIEEFNKKYKILNTQKEVLFKSQSSYYQQPKTDYEITSNTLHSAIHSSILINDKNPRVFESFNLFDKYSDQLLTDVIQRMSSQHKIIAPTKYSELKKKNVTAFSKHIGKAYHISQRYQYKWVNNISASVLDETKKFKNDLTEFKLGQSENKSGNEEMFDCTDRDDMGMTSFLAHTIDNSDIQVQIDVPNKIWVSKLI